MFYHFTRIASFILAFGFFISCTTLESTNQNNRPSTDLSEEQIKQRIDSLDEQINSDQNDPELFYQQGSLLTKLAQKKDHPSDRTEFYTDAYEVLTQASDLYKNSSDTESEKVEELLNVTWSNEHNQGVQVLQSDTTSESPDYLRAAAHFKNATVVIPDSAISYKMGARAYYKSKDPQKAIDILNSARTNIVDPPAELLEQLAFLYLENDQQEEAVKVYEQAESFSDQNLNLLHGLANAYISNGQHQKAVELLRRLIENEPQNVIYGQSLAKELYFIAAEKLEAVGSELQQGKQLENTSFAEADSLLNSAKNQFAQVLEKNSNDQELILSFAKFYQNSASKYQQLIPVVEQQQKVQLGKKVNQFVSNSIPLFEQLAEELSDDQHIWQNLYQAYSFLGMEEKARNAKSNL